RLNDQFVSLVIQTPAGMVGGGGGLLQDRVASDHLARDQILADTEVLERTLSLCTPELVGRDVHHAEAICFSPDVGHVIFPSVLPPFTSLALHQRSVPASAAKHGLSAFPSLRMSPVDTPSDVGLLHFQRQFLRREPLPPSSPRSGRQPWR